MRSQKCLIWIGVLTASLVLPTACRRAEVKIYDVPKDANTPSVAQSLSQPASREPIAWTPPSHWKELPPTQFRKGNYLFVDEAGSAEITVTAFPGQTGGLLANANRWLLQVNLPEISEEQLAEVSSDIALEQNRTATALDLKAATNAEGSSRIYAAVVPYAGQSWFFKMSGPYSTVESQIPAFSSFVRGLRFGESGETPQPLAQAADSHEGDLAFTPPAGWVESPGSSVRIASFSIEKEGYPPADFSITAFPGDTGGLTANVNRWRDQIGLAKWNDQQVAAASKLLKNPAGLEFQIVELKPESEAEKSTPGEWIRAAVMPYNGKTWFFKMRGDAVLVDLQRDEFEALLQSVHFSHAGHNH